MALLSGLLDTLRGRLSVQLLWKIFDKGFGAFHAEENRNCTADSRVATHNQCLLSSELACGFVGLVVIIIGQNVIGRKLGVLGFRTLHFKLQSGRVLVLDRNLMVLLELGVRQGSRQLVGVVRRPSTLPH